MRILTVLGARPQFVKAAPVSAALAAAGYAEILVHTGQHYDHGMSEVFFEELGIPRPAVNLGIGSGGHGHQTGEMLARLEEVMEERHPDWVLVYGDTNSTLAGALAAAKLHLPVAHVEAGLRSFNKAMPEEINRILTDHCAALLFCPTANAVELLAREGIAEGVHQVGDVMFDAVLRYRDKAQSGSTILSRLGLAPKGYLLATLHRPYNVDDPVVLGGILRAFLALNQPIVLPVHPRTRHRLGELPGLPDLEGSPVRLIEPVGFLDMICLECGARLILTDSGGVQKEAFFLSVPCVTLRPETEWIETVRTGWNRLACGGDAILEAVARGGWPEGVPPALFGDGHAAEKIAGLLAAQQA